ncbi:MAG: hypothetical protein KGJ06_01840 [Pseudomonadota bacterium]|nr:hypothetical protein [Pseudomonadota bacterium]
MSEVIGNWVEKAKAAGAANAPVNGSGIRVIRREQPRGKGNVILDLAEKIRPWLMQMAEGVRDKNGLAVQPPHVRAVALNLAQRIVKEQEAEANG